MIQSFADKSHSGSIRCVAVHERWIASGGTDDRIFIYDMSTRKQSQVKIFIDIYFVIFIDIQFVLDFTTP